MAYSSLPCPMRLRSYLRRLDYYEKQNADGNGHSFQKKGSISNWVSYEDFQILVRCVDSMEYFRGSIMCKTDAVIVKLKIMKMCIHC